MFLNAGRSTNLGFACLELPGSAAAAAAAAAVAGADLGARGDTSRLACRRRGGESECLVCTDGDTLLPRPGGDDLLDFGGSVDARPEPWRRGGLRWRGRCPASNVWDGGSGKASGLMYSYAPSFTPDERSGLARLETRGGSSRGS